MADEEKKNEQAGEKAPEEQAPEENAAEEKAPEAASEEAAPKEAPADDAPAGDAGEAAAPEAGAGDDELEGMDWKARARLERSRRSGEAGPQQSADERAAERRAKRAAAAKKRSSYRKRSRERRKGSGEGTPPAERAGVAPKIRQGTVVSDKADKTITVRIDIVRRHPAYEKIVRRSSKLHAHDERNEANEGDVVRLVETRPLSRTKRWRLDEILEKAK